MPLTPAEVSEIVHSLAELSSWLHGALRKDSDGKVRIDKAESRQLLKRLTLLAALVARDALD